MRIPDSHTFSQRLVHWYQSHKRSLPWREDPTPYKVWVSEIMLQQTQVSRVTDYFTRFMAAFPDVFSLARAGEEEVLSLWEGLGYYSRAKNMMAAARVVARERAGRFPESPEELAALPGIGPYTAGAVASIAFNRPCPAVDANIERVLARVLDLDKPVARAKADLARLARELIPEGRARDFNQALMELGALVCSPRSPRCHECPVRPHCAAAEAGTAESRPVKPEPPKTVSITMATGVLVRDGRLYVQKRPATGVWANLWEFPGGVAEEGESPEEALRREIMEETGLTLTGVRPLAVIRHSYTIYRVRMHGFLCQSLDPLAEPLLLEAQAGAWLTLADLEKKPFSAAHRKLLKRLEALPCLAL